MVLNESIDATPVNARATDRFDLFDFKHYAGPNPYLERGALVFNFALTDYDDPPPLKDFIEIIAERYPQSPKRDDVRWLQQTCRLHRAGENRYPKHAFPR